MQRCGEQGLEYQVVFSNQVANDFFVFAAQVEHSDFAFHLGHIIDDFVCLRFTEREVVTGAAKLADDIDKGVYGEGIVLATDGKNRVPVFAPLVVFFEERGLFKNLARIGEELVAFVRDGDPFVAANENRYTHFFFELVNSGCQAGLRYKDSLGCFGDI